MRLRRQFGALGPRQGRADYDIKAELMPIAACRDKVTVFSGFNCILGGRSNLAHWSGVMATLTGSAPKRGGQNGGAADDPTIDVLVSYAIGTNSRFRSLEVARAGKPGVSYSMRAGTTVNPREVAPIGLYKRIFGPEFKDPNAADFKPDPEIMLRQSVLSSSKTSATRCSSRSARPTRRSSTSSSPPCGRTRSKSPCSYRNPRRPRPARSGMSPRKHELGPTWDVAVKTHDLLTGLVVMALACNQTRVFNVALSNAASNLRKSDWPVSFHQLTHEEPIDPQLGYQPKSTFFIEESVKAFGTLVKKLAEIKEGDGTLLDHSLMLATSESNYAKIHSIENLPILVAGTAGGKWKGGQHIVGKGDPSSRVGLTIQQVLGMPVDNWGSGAMQTSRAISEVIA